jgi:hypothetical protein
MVMSLSAKIFSVTLFPLVSVVSNEGNFSLPASVPAEAVLPSFAEEAADDELLADEVVLFVDDEPLLADDVLLSAAEALPDVEAELFFVAEELPPFP